MTREQFKEAVKMVAAAHEMFVRFTGPQFLQSLRKHVDDPSLVQIRRNRIDKVRLRLVPQIHAACSSSRKMHSSFYEISVGIPDSPRALNDWSGCIRFVVTMEASSRTKNATYIDKRLQEISLESRLFSFSRISGTLPAFELARHYDSARADSMAGDLKSLVEATATIACEPLSALCSPDKREDSPYLLDHSIGLKSDPRITESRTGPLWDGSPSKFRDDNSLMNRFYELSKQHERLTVGAKLLKAHVEFCVKYLKTMQLAGAEGEIRDLVVGRLEKGMQNLQADGSYVWGEE